MSDGKALLIAFIITAVVVQILYRYITKQQRRKR